LSAALKSRSKYKIPATDTKTLNHLAS